MRLGFFFWLTTVLSVSISKRDGIDYSVKGSVKGVNLGGWFVIEPFITPSLFEAFGDNVPNDEYHFSETLGKEETLSRLSAHWSSWITEEDFKNIKSFGLNLVRIPIGYWAFIALEGDPYVQGQVPYLDAALGWAKDNGLQVWIDLHGAPGSQNGFDNSGYREEAQYLTWLQEENMNVTKQVLESIVAKYSGYNYSDVVAGIEFINEPLGTYLDINSIKNYYLDGYTLVRNTYNSRSNIILHDAFRDQHFFDDFLPHTDYWGVVIDHHRYQVFSEGELQRSIEDRVLFVCNQGKSTASETHWTVTGEWSAALTDCTKWLNGAGRGARYDGTYESSSALGTCWGNDEFNGWSDERKQDTRKFIEAQLDSYNQGAGWIFWNLKTENSIEWDLQKLIYHGLFPQPLSDRKYTNQCGF